MILIITPLLVAIAFLAIGWRLDTKTLRKERDFFQMHAERSCQHIDELLEIIESMPNAGIDVYRIPNRERRNVN